MACPDALCLRYFGGFFEFPRMIMLPFLSKVCMYTICYVLNGSHCRPSASNQRADSTLFLRTKRKVRLRRFELPRDYLPLGPQPSGTLRFPRVSEVFLQKIAIKSRYVPTFQLSNRCLYAGA